MKIVVTGAEGQLGKELKRVFAHRGFADTVYVDRQELDLTDEAAVRAFILSGDFTHIINCAAYTAVDRAEEEKAQCRAVNQLAVEFLARIAEEADMKILHVSTDYVFDGNLNRPYTEVDKPAPLNVYGSTKRKGETALMGLAPESIIIRTGWLYSPHGKNFVKTMLRMGKDGIAPSVVVDQIGTPTYAGDLAEAIASIVLSRAWVPGIYHYSDEGVASWYDFAVAIFEESGLTDLAALIKPIPSSDFPSAATRPPYAVLDKQKIKATYSLTIPHWRSSLRRCLSELRDNN